MLKIVQLNYLPMNDFDRDNRNDLHESAYSNRILRFMGADDVSLLWNVLEKRWNSCLTIQAAQQGLQEQAGLLPALNLFFIF